MRNRKRTTSILAGVMAGILLLSLLGSLLTTMVSAASSSEIKSQIDDLKDEKAEIDKQIKELEGQISDNMGEMEKIVAQKNLIDQEIFLLNEQKANLSEQITAYGQLVADKQDELDQAQKRLEDLNKKNQERIYAMEKNGDVSYWSVLFKATDFMDMLDRMRMVFQINQADKQCLQELNAAANEVAAAKDGLETEMAALEESQKELEQTEKNLAGKRAEADKLLTDLVARGAEYEALMADAEEEADKRMQEILKKEKEYDAAKKKEHEAWLNAQKPVTPPAPPSGGVGGSSGGPGNIGGSGAAGTPRVVNGVTWLVPISYNHFTSPFGYRKHPVYGDYRLHNGADLSAPAGTPIYASRSGKVSIATYGSSGGYYVMINHMDGYSTAYLHMTHYIVKPGQDVQAGQLIGYCGSTGVSTGPHLHFSVYYNGVPVNPADYIAI